MAPAGRASRKRAIEDANSDPCQFLQTYFQARGIPESPDDDAELLGNCTDRAEKARESFKRWRGSGDEREEAAARAASDDPPDRELTAKEKYQRRLVNNRKSAAASRVFQEVLRREHTHALREVSKERDRLSDDLELLKSTLSKLKEENARLAVRDGAHNGPRPDSRGGSLGGVAVQTSRSDATEAVLPMPDDVPRPGSFGGSSGIARDEDCDSDVPNCVYGERSVARKVMAKVDMHDPLFHKNDQASAPVGGAPLLTDSLEVNASEAVAKVARAILPMFGSQSQGQGQSQDDGLLCRAPGNGPSLFSGILNSQLSATDGPPVQLRGTQATPSSVPIDEFPDAPDLFGSQSLRLSQVLGSQPVNSQPTASQLAAP